MNKEIQKAFRDVVATSLNSDQVNALGQQMDRRFDIHELSGFGTKIAIPGTAAAETLLHFLKTEERVVEFFERMLDQEGKFIYDSTVKLNYRDDFIRLLGKNKWIFDVETKRFLRDPFFAEQLNFLKQLEMIDLRRSINLPAFSQQLQEDAVRLKLEDLNWQVTIRTYRLTGEIATFLRDIISLLLMKQNLGSLSAEIYTCLNEMAINASKATYKVLFERHVAKPAGVDPKIEYNKFASMFREELEEHGDENLHKLAAAEDKYFDVIFRSTDANIACWTTNYTSISRPEKLRLLQRLNYTMFGENLTELMEDPHREGAGLGINLILTILGRLTPEKHPLKPVFYQDRTKIGFVLKREALVNYVASRQTADT
ncbi:MAG: hypothetical protein K1X70_04970 [Leptospirales bacterium]|nr:hypothetical protein [Leptospirales bacterium]HNL01797.1 hypothetical protein [Leptospiraceae bacterium]